MIYERRYIQFNDLVFDGVDMISDFDGDMSFKGSSIERSYGHGSYRPFKANYLFVAERTVSMTVTLYMKKLPCEYRPFYDQFVKAELSKPGRLWAIQNGELQWAWAIVENISQNYSGREDVIVYDINFVLPGGVWHKADKERTFLVPWDICLFMECMEYQTLDPCKVEVVTGDCCQDCQNKKVETSRKEDCYCCCVDKLSCEMQLCYHKDKLQDFFGCEARYQIVYDCKKAEEFARDKYLGQKFCIKDICNDSIITGRFYSETDIPHENVTVIIDGLMHNPWITINGNTNIIKGDYDGTLIIRPNGDVYYKTECCETLLDPSVWEVPGHNKNDYGWTIYPRENSIVVNLNICCSRRSCVYIQDDPQTI